MKALLAATALALGLAASPAAFASSASDNSFRVARACQKSAFDQNRAGTDKANHIKKCVADSCKQATSLRLAAEARESEIKKCKSAACAQSAKDQMLAGAAGDSYVQTCVADATGGKR